MKHDATSSVDTPADHRLAVVEDLSFSNLAILCLPLVLAFAPVSFFDTVSDVVVLWYWLATDVLSVLPLLIKSIEVIILEGSAGKSVFSSTMDYHESRYGIFETWSAQCAVVPVHGIRSGPILLAIATWTMIASSVAELIVWRWRRLQCQLKLADLDELEASYRTRRRDRNTFLHSRAEGR